MFRLTCAVTVILANLAFAGGAMGATISITPTSGPVGTVVSFQGVASECDEHPGADAEVFAQIGEAAPRTPIEVDGDGAYSGTWAMPDPADSLARGTSVRAFPVAVRCVDADGTHDELVITPAPAMFTYTSATVPEACVALTGLTAQSPVDSLLVQVQAGLQVVLRGNVLANTIAGNVLANVIDGFSGNDVLRGRGGDDVIRGGLGNDRAFGDGGSDSLVGGPGSDTLQGGSGADALNANDATSGDTVDGGPGSDTCTVNRGDVVRGCERVRLR